jgi:hypothetical protein
MLNGDAHHSLTWEVELRIWPLLIIKDSIAAEHNRAAEFVHPFSRGTTGLIRRSEGPAVSSPVRQGGEMRLLAVWSAEGAPRFVPALSGLGTIEGKVPRPDGRGYLLPVLRT